MMIESIECHPEKIKQTIPLVPWRGKNEEMDVKEVYKILSGTDMKRE